MNWPKNFLTYTVSNFLIGMFPIWEHTFKQLLRVCYYSICHFISCFVLKENWKMKWIGINSPAIKILNFCRTRLPPKLDFPIWWDRSYGQSFEIMSWIFFLMIHTPQDFFMDTSIKIDFMCWNTLSNAGSLINVSMWELRLDNIKLFIIFCKVIIKW